MRVLPWLRQYYGWLVYLGLVAAVAVWSKWDRRNMPIESAGCMTINRIKAIDETFAAAAVRVGRTIEQTPLYFIDEKGCAWWERPQKIYRD